MLYAFIPHRDDWLYFFIASILSVAIIWALYPLTESKSAAPRKSHIVDEQEDTVLETTPPCDQDKIVEEMDD